MNPLDRWREILDVLLRRKLRTALTALSVAWGIFMLVILLAAGNGLATGVQTTFARDATNSVWVNAGALSKPFRGNPIGKRVQLYRDDEALVRDAVPPLESLDARFGGDEREISRGSLHRRSEVRGCLPGRAQVHNLRMSEGRFFDDDDVRERRRVAVVERKLVDTLFRPGEQALEAWIRVGTTTVQIIGIFEETDDESEQGLVYLPLPLAQLLYGAGNLVRQFSFTLSTPSAETESLLDGLKRALAGRKGFAADDKRAVFVWSAQEVFDKVTGLFDGIRAFVWLIGLGTILAGIVGVSNIMFISVSERTREIGVRKAVGAPPMTIVRMIVEEAMVITIVSGYLGLVAAVAVVNVVASVMPKTEFFSRPEVNLGVGVMATGVLVVAGTLAGLFPALRAARINPIAALRVE